MKKNDIINVYIQSSGFEGEGIARVDGLPVFIRGGAVGDHADIRILKVNKNFAFGKIEKVTQPSPFRREPVCKTFGKCGGCTMAHITYDKQLEIKKNTVTSNLRKIAHLSEGDYLFEGIDGADSEYNYRNKAQFPVAYSEGKAVFGFFAPGSHRVIPCTRCNIQDDKINVVAEAVLDYINENNVSVYDENTGKGIIRHIYVRTSVSGDIMTVIVTNTSKPLPFCEKLIEKLSNIEGMKSIIQNTNTRGDNIIMGNKNTLLWGDDKIILTLGDLKFYVSPNSFFQVNPGQTEKLYAKALEYALLTGTETVFDLYCGVGSISLFMAEKAKEVYGVEIVDDAIENAKANAEINGIENTSFYSGDCTDIVDKLMKQGKTADVVVVDPPRKGCDPNLLQLINNISPKRVVYVSCNSSTFARDTVHLSQFGYTLKKVSAVDLFPQTAHVECVGLFTRK